MRKVRQSPVLTRPERNEITEVPNLQNHWFCQMDRTDKFWVLVKFPGQSTEVTHQGNETPLCCIPWTTSPKDIQAGKWSNKDGRVEGDRAENITLNDISRRISLLPPVFCRCFKDQCWKSTCAPAHLISTCPASLWHWGKVDTREKREDGSGRPAVVREGKEERRNSGRGNISSETRGKIPQPFS